MTVKKTEDFDILFKERPEIYLIQNLVELYFSLLFNLYVYIYHSPNFKLFRVILLSILSDAC